MSYMGRGAKEVGFRHRALTFKFREIKDLISSVLLVPVSYIFNSFGFKVTLS